MKHYNVWNHQDVEITLSHQPSQKLTELNSTNVDAAWGMYNVFHGSGWEAHLLHYTDTQWFAAHRLPLIKRLEGLKGPGIIRHYPPIALATAKSLPPVPV